MWWLACWLLWVWSLCGLSREFSGSDLDSLGGATMLVPHVVGSAGLFGEVLFQAVPGCGAFAAPARGQCVVVS